MSSPFVSLAPMRRRTVAATMRPMSTVPFDRTRTAWPGTCALMSTGTVLGGCAVRSSILVAPEHLQRRRHNDGRDGHGRRLHDELAEGPRQGVHLVLVGAG